jgi:hypothetical protein
MPDLTASFLAVGSGRLGGRGLLRAVAVSAARARLPAGPPLFPTRRLFLRPEPVLTPHRRPSSSSEKISYGSRSVPSAACRRQVGARTDPLRSICVRPPLRRESPSATTPSPPPRPSCHPPSLHCFLTTEDEGQSLLPLVLRRRQRRVDETSSVARPARDQALTPSPTAPLAHA